jgi:hypothetical protein
MAGSMNWTRRRYEIAAVVPVVAVFVALYVWFVPTENPNRSAEVYGYIAALFALPIMLWLVYRRPARPTSARRHGGLAATTVRQPSLPAPAGHV